MLGEEVGKKLVSPAAEKIAQLATQRTSHSGRVIIRTGLRRQLVSTGTGSAANLAVQSAPHAGRVIMETFGQQVARMVAGRVILETGASQSVAQSAAQSAASDLGSGVGGTVAGGAVAVVIEGMSIVRDIANVGGDLNAGRINYAIYNRFVGRRLATGTGGVAGYTFGMVVGQMLIPVPFLGAAIGSVAGALFGRFAGNVAGTALFD